MKLASMYYVGPTFVCECPQCDSALVLIDPKAVTQDVQWVLDTKGIVRLVEGPEQGDYHPVVGRPGESVACPACGYTMEVAT